MNFLRKLNSRSIASRSNFTKNIPEFDLKYLCNENFFNEIENNIEIRKGIGDIHKVHRFYKNFLSNETDDANAKKIFEEFIEEAKKIPNKTHPDVQNYGSQPKLIKYINQKQKYEQENFHPCEFSEITKKLNVMRTSHMGNFTGSRSYYFMDSLAELEEALLKYSISNLINKGFQLISVPDVLPSHVIESCGMNVKGERAQVYFLDELHYGPNLCLSGTAEMSLASLFINTVHEEKSLPLKLAAVSRCYRAEGSSILEEKGIYRVHQFTKVEMFGITTPNNSDQLLEEFREIEEESFANLDLHMRVLDMPPHELGAPAYRKYDIEAWMPGRQIFGEISSCSNCTDYQSRRLHIKYISDCLSEKQFVHTLNGTACAIPRMLIALLETHQKPNGQINIPKPLQKYINKDYIKKEKRIPEQKLIKIK